MRLPLLFLAICSLSAPLAAADAYYQQWRWSQLGLDEGLPSETVLAIEESADSTLWVGLRTGVAWYDGYRFSILGPEQGVPERPVGTIAALAEGGMALAVEGKLYTGGRDGFTHVPLAFDVYAMAASRGDGLGLLSKDSRVFVWRRGEVTQIPLPEGVEPQEVTGLPAAGGDIWLRADSGSFRLRGGRWITEQRQRNLKHPATTEDGRRYGSVDLPLADRGLWSWEEGGDLVRQAEEVTDLVRLIVSGPGNRVLVVFESGAILTRHGGDWVALDPLPEAMHDILSAVFRRSGDLALATSHGVHLYRASGRTWQHWHTAGAGARNRVDEILQASNGDVWLGTDAGVEVRHRDGRVSWFDEALGQPLRIITALGEDDEGGIWVGSGAYWAGAFRYYAGEWRFYGSDEGLGACRIHRIHRDRDGRLYFLGLSGVAASTHTLTAEVSTYHRGRFGRFEPGEKLGAERIHSMAQTPDGAIWLTGVRGVGRYLGDSRTLWTVKEGLRRNGVFTVAADAGGSVYFADRHHGLGRLRFGGEPEYLDVVDGLIHDQVWDLDVDAAGRVWVATRGGLSSLLDGMWTSFGTAAGLEALELWPVAVGEVGILVGTAGKGTFVLDRDASSAPVQVYFEPALVSKERVVVRWRPLSYEGQVPSDRIQTRAAIDDQPWSPWTTDREAVYARLSSGVHTVRVQAANAASTYDEAGFVTEFSVPARLYARPVFFLPIGLSSLAVLVLSVALVTRRRRHATALAASEDRYRSFFREAPISLWEQDFSEARAYLEQVNIADEASLRAHLQINRREVFEATRRVRILDANRATLDLFRCDSLQSLTDQIHRIFRHDSFAAFAEGLIALHRGDARFGRESVAYALDGTPRNVILNWAVAPGAGEAYDRVLVSVLDVTPQRRAAEEQRQAAQVAQEASRAKSTFLANTSHEIRTPINAVMGMAQALRDEELPPRATDQVDTILQATEALTEVVDDLLDLSKIEAGQLELETLTFAPAQTVEAARRTLEARAAGKGIALTASVAPDTAAAVDGDRVRLRQILLNLVGNAVKFTDEGTVEIRLRSELEGGRVRLYFEVCDSGIGIAADRLEHIFQPFTQADASVTRTHGGTGLGLSISKRLVDMMGGHMSVESQPGRGSTFAFDVLVDTGTGQVDEAIDAAAGDTPPLRILLAEDNALNRKVVHALLSRDAHQIVEAENGALALEAVRSGGPFDVILMDMQMPEMDGLTATEAIRRLEGERGRDPVRIVALTANAMRGDRERCLAAGMDDFLTKPVRKEQLRAALARVAGGAALGAAPRSAAPASATASELLDPAPMEELRDLAEFDETLSVAGFIREFLDDARQCLERARQAASRGEAEALRREVHTVKGNSRQIGAVELGDRAEALELQLKKGRSVDAGAGLDGLQHSLEQVGVLLEEVARREDAANPPT